LRRLPTVLIVLIVLLLPLSLAGAQSGALMDHILQEPHLSVAEAAYLVGLASGKLSETGDTQGTILLQTLGWSESSNDPTRAVTAAQYAWLLAQSFPLPRGLWAWMFPGPRYSYRDLVFRGFFPRQGDPDALLTGGEAIQILTKVLESLPGGRT